MMGFHFMNYLVKTGGELYLPERECSAGASHYCEIDADRVEVDVSPGRPALRYLGQLVRQWKDIDDDGRINLLHEGDGEPLVEAYVLRRGRMFDFFVRSDEERALYLRSNFGSPRRFLYRNGVILAEGGRRIGKPERVRELFGEVHGLELSHVSSPGAEFASKDDGDVVYDWERKQDESRKARMRQKLGRLKWLEPLIESDMTAARVLLAVAGIRGGAEEDDVIDALRTDGHDCGCYFTDHDGEDEAKRYIDALAGNGLLVERDGLYRIATKGRRQAALASFGEF